MVFKETSTTHEMLNVIIASNDNIQYIQNNDLIFSDLEKVFDHQLYTFI